MHYYAFYNYYGNNTTDTAGNRIGTLYIFDTKRERDEWNDDEDYRDGNLHREAISAKEARRMLVDYIYGEAPFRVSSKFFWRVMSKYAIYRMFDGCDAPYNVEFYGHLVGSRVWTGDDDPTALMARERVADLIDRPTCHQSGR